MVYTANTAPQLAFEHIEVEDSAGTALLYMLFVLVVPRIPN